ncbi:hypothetical protein PG988_011453 [Apiospora saccharicola]
MGNHHDRKDSRAGSSSRRLPPMDYDSSSDEGRGSYSRSHRDQDRRHTLEPPVSTGYSSSTAGFDYYAKDRTARGTTGSSNYDNTSGYYGNTSSGQGYSSSQYSSGGTQGYGSSQYSSSGTQGYGASQYASNVQGAKDWGAGRQRGPVGSGSQHHSIGLNTDLSVAPQRTSRTSSSRDDSSKTHFSSSKRTSNHHSSRSTCKDPKDKGRKDDYSDDSDYDDAPRSHTIRSTPGGGRYGVFRAY